jgi:predicted HicB family RNase H-like nuclease
MKKSASYRSAEAVKGKSKDGETITSLDGTKTISWKEFEQLFDKGSDEIDAFIDWTKTTAHGGKRPGSGRKPSGRKSYQIRMKPEVHRRLKSHARKRGKSISEVLESLVPMS